MQTWISKSIIEKYKLKRKSDPADKGPTKKTQKQKIKIKKYECGNHDHLIGPSTLVQAMHSDIFKSRWLRIEAWCEWTCWIKKKKKGLSYINVSSVYSRLDREREMNQRKCMFSWVLQFWMKMTICVALGLWRWYVISDKYIIVSSCILDYVPFQTRCNHVSCKENRHIIWAGTYDW